MHKATDSLEIGHERFHARRVMKRCGRVIHRRHQKASGLPHRAAQMTHPHVGFQDELSGKITHGDEQPRTDSLHLRAQKRGARFDFRR